MTKAAAFYYAVSYDGQDGAKLANSQYNTFTTQTS